MFLNLVKELPNLILDQNTAYVLVPLLKQANESQKEMNTIQKALIDQKNVKLFDDYDGKSSKKIKLSSDSDYVITVTVEKKDSEDFKSTDAETPSKESSSNFVVKNEENEDRVELSPEKSPEVKRAVRKKQLSKNTMAQNYLALTVIGFVNWIEGLCSKDCKSQKKFLEKIQEHSKDLNEKISLKEEIMSYIKEKIKGKTGDKNKYASTSCKKKIIKRDDYKRVMCHSERDDVKIKAIKTVLNHMMREFFELENFLDYLKKSKANLNGKLFLIYNREVLRKIMTEDVNTSAKFKQDECRIALEKYSTFDIFLKDYLKTQDSR